MKRKLMLLGGVLLTSLLGAIAQTSPWVGSPVGEGEFYLYNVESGLWLQNNDSKANDWSTRAAIGTRGFEWKLVLNDGAYALQPNFYINGTSNMTWSINPDNNYIDTNDGKAWEFHVYDAMVSAGISNAYTINSGNKVLGTVKYNEAAHQENLFTQQGDDRWYLENPDFNINMSERITWQLVTKEERLAKMAAEASESNPVDASWLIPAADFANNDKRYELWTRSLNGGNGRTGDGNGINGSSCIESWNSNTIDFSITLSVPNGTYRFTVQGYYRDGSFEDVLNRRNDGTETIRSYYFANEVEAPLMSILDEAKTESTSGWDRQNGELYYPDSQNAANRCFNLNKGYVNPEIEVVVTTGQLKIGIKKTENAANDWTVFDNFHLTYLGPVDVSAYLESLNAAIAEAESLNTDATSDKAKENLNAALSTARTKTSSLDSDEISEATANLQAAINIVKAVDIAVLRQTLAVAEEGIDLTGANNAIANALTAQEVTDALFDLRTARKISAMRMPDIYTGSAPENGVEYFFYNIGTGLFLNNGSDWNTHTAVDIYALPVTLVADGENFKLKNHAFYRDEQWINFNAYVDTGNQDRWFFQPVEGKQNVYNIVVFDRHDLALGYNPYGHTDRGFGYHYPFNVAKEQTDMANPYNQWKLVSRAELEALMEKTSAENPADVSYLIKNPGLSRFWNLSGSIGDEGTHPSDWNLTCDGGNRGKVVTVGDDGDMNRNGDYGYEVWNANSFSFTQTITGLKPGVYEVGVSGFFRQGDGSFQTGIVNDGGELISEASLVANGESVALPNIATEVGKLPGIFSQNSNNGTFANWPAEALNAFETGLYKTSVRVVVGTNGELTLGVKQDQKTTDNSWVLFDSFRLAYCGPVEIESMTIVGNFCGEGDEGWKIENGFVMTQDEENPAIWTATKDVTVEGKTYEYKVTANGVWGEYELPASGNQNWGFGTDMYPAGDYRLVFTADTENHTLTLAVYGKQSLTLDENATEQIDAYEYADVTVNRAFNEGWNAVVLPFDTEAFNNAKIVELDNETVDGEGNVTLKFKQAESIKANVPYLVNFPAAVPSDKVFYGVNVAPAEAKVEGEYFDFVGTHVKATVVSEGDYVISGGKLSKATTDIELKGGRTFFKAKTQAGVRSVTLSFDDDVTTGISVISNATVQKSIYNLQGQKVNKASKGIFIENGKKVIK